MFLAGRCVLKHFATQVALHFVVCSMYISCVPPYVLGYDVFITFLAEDLACNIKVNYFWSGSTQVVGWWDNHEDQYINTTVLQRLFIEVFWTDEHVFNSNIYYVSLSCAFYMKRRFWTSSCRAGTGPQCCYARLSCVWWSSPQSCYKFRTSCFCLGIQQIQW